MIETNEKKEEYREIKMYWATRLTTGFPNEFGIDIINPDFIEFDYIQFKNGYNNSARVLKIKWEGCKIKTGNPRWGAIPDKLYYSIQLGNKL